MKRLRSQIGKVFRVFFTGSAFLLFWTGGALLSWIAIPALTFLYRRDPVLAQRRCRQLMCSSFRFHVRYMQLCRLIDYDAKSIEAQLPRGPFVLIANHPTLIDVVLLLASYPSICCVAKAEIFESPLVGSMLRACGHINAGAGTLFDGVSVMDGAVARLQAGDPVLIFPEGTRSPWLSVGRFRAGAFVIASRAQVPVVPVSIRARPPGLMKGMSWYTVPDSTIRYEVSVLPALDPPTTERGAKVSATAARALIEARVSS